MAKSPTEHFLSNISKWNYNIPQKTQWVVQIEPENKSNFFQTIGSNRYSRLDDNNFIVAQRLQTIQEQLLGGKTQPNTDGLGLFFAQDITVPKEGFTVGNVGIDGMNGYLKGSVGGDRFAFDQKQLKISFLETNLDFVSGLIRPWIITASYRGLINLGLSNSIKADITLVEYTNSTNTEEKPKRREHLFTGCVPTDITDMELKQSGQDVSIIPVTWTFIKHTYKIFAGPF
jgi:hypothetical protein